MLRKTCLFLVIILLISCNSKKSTSFPNNGKVLTTTQMTDVLVDLYLTEAILINNVEESSNLKESTTHYYKDIFKKHHITRQQFLNSMQYYCFQTKELSQINNDVINHLTFMQSKSVK